MHRNLIFAGTLFLALAVCGICVRRLRAKSRSRNRWVDYQLEELKIEAIDVRQSSSSYRGIQVCFEPKELEIVPRPANVNKRAVSNRCGASG